MAASKKTQGAPAPPPAKAPAEGAAPAPAPAPAPGSAPGAAASTPATPATPAPAVPAEPPVPGSTPAGAQDGAAEGQGEGNAPGVEGASVVGIPTPAPGDGVARPIEGGPFPPAALLPTEARAPEAFALGIDPAHPGQDRSTPPGEQMPFEEDLDALVLAQQKEVDRLREEVRQLHLQLDEANAVVRAARSDHAADRDAWAAERAALRNEIDEWSADNDRLKELLRHVHPTKVEVDVHFDGEPHPRGNLPPLETDEHGNAMMRERTFPGPADAPASPAPVASPAPLPPGHVRVRVKRGSVVLSIGTRREADGAFVIAAWEIRGLDDVVEVLARG